MRHFCQQSFEIFYFIITPEELGDVLEGMHLLVTSRRVSGDYRETPLEEYLESYRVIYRKLASGEQVTRQDLWNCMTMGVVRDLEKYGYLWACVHRGEEFYTQDFEEPCPFLECFPFHLGRMKDGRPMLVLNVLNTQFPENVMGLELVYPKQISYWQDGVLGPLVSTKELESYQDYLLLRDRIREITKPLKLVIAGKEIRPRVRISPRAMEDVESFWFMKTNDARIIR